MDLPKGYARATENTFVASLPTPNGIYADGISPFNYDDREKLETLFNRIGIANYDFKFKDVVFVNQPVSETQIHDLKEAGYDCHPRPPDTSYLPPGFR